MVVDAWTAVAGSAAIVLAGAKMIQGYVSKRLEEVVDNSRGLIRIGGELEAMRRDREHDRRDLDSLTEQVGRIADTVGNINDSLIEMRARLTMSTEHMVRSLDKSIGDMERRITDALHGGS